MKDLLNCPRYADAYQKLMSVVSVYTKSRESTDRVKAVCLEGVREARGLIKEDRPVLARRVDIRLFERQLSAYETFFLKLSS